MVPRKFGPDDHGANDYEFNESEEIGDNEYSDYEWSKDREQDRRREAARRWDEKNQRIAKVSLGWVKGQGPYYINERTQRPVGWNTDRESGPKFEPTRKLSHAVGAAQEIARRRRALPFTLTFDGKSGWEARFSHRPIDTVVTDSDPTKAVWMAVLKLNDELKDPNSIFRD